MGHINCKSLVIIIHLRYSYVFYFIQSPAFSIISPQLGNSLPADCNFYQEGEFKKKVPDGRCCYADHF